ncbi:hypothetical protein N7520_011063 [Penicillium odoratum]|uniref:uncharacterized protein n=1 Tax=Penicillium odoratum TaxID=1167516 RepID=UPI0025497C1A|nr:uncharacterized protein N7520_011063 [Penicillium odoratum]KAJ5745881.1 hypothetical protein N7520_011063 [Penicillium odoratum]
MVEDLDTLWEIFAAAVTDREATNLICILDGLDEMEIVSQRKLLECVNKLYNKKDLEARPFVKFIIFSRPENTIKTCFTRNVATVRLRGEDEAEAISKDVEMVVRNHMNELERQCLPRNVLMELQQVLIHKADRTFLWTTLMISLLEDTAMDGASEKELKELLGNRDIDNVYAALLARSTNRDRSKKLLQIVLGARRPLTLWELNVALAVSPQKPSFRNLQSELKHLMENYVKATCGHFIRVIHERVYLVHQTAREFLLQQHGDTNPSQLGHWYQSLKQVECDNVVPRSCISSLFLVTVADDQSDEMPQPQLLFPYARGNWFQHCHNSNLDTFQEIVHVALRLHDQWPKSPSEWFFAHSLILQLNNWQFVAPDNDSWNVPRAKVVFILDTITKTLLCDPRLDVRACDRDTRTILHYAAAAGSLNLVQALLSRGVQISARNRDFNTPLHVAANFYAQNNSRVDRAGMAYYSRPASETRRVIDYLIRQGAHIDAVGYNARTPLIIATQCGAMDLVEIFCSHDANANATDTTGMTPLMFAVEQGSFNLVKCLISHGANVNCARVNGETPLLLASERGLTEIVAALLAHGADVNAKGRNKRTALHWAVENVNHSTIEAILDKDPDLSQFDSNGDTAFRILKRRPTISGDLPGRLKGPFE